MNRAVVIAVLVGCTGSSPPRPDAYVVQPPPPPVVGDTCSSDFDCAGGVRPMLCVAKTEIVPLTPPICTVRCTSDADCAEAAIGISGWACGTTGIPPTCVPYSWLDP